MKIKLLGIDLAKNVFQVCALNQASIIRDTHFPRGVPMAADKRYRVFAFLNTDIQPDPRSQSGSATRSAHSVLAAR